MRRRRYSTNLFCLRYSSASDLIRASASLPDGVDAVIKKCDGVTGIRDIEQAAEHIVAHALYQIEVNHVQSVTFDGAVIEELLS